MLIKNLIKKYKINKNEFKAIDNLSLSLPEKGLVFIVGKSGSGKSTFLNLIGGLLEIDGGDIIFNGDSLKAMNEQELDNHRLNNVSFIFQDFCLIDSLNVLENIKTPLFLKRDLDFSKIDELLNKLEIFDCKTKYPNQLSAGQKQRTAIARAVIRNTPILLCDEPTGNLDSKNSEQILKILKEISKDKLVIVVSHNNDDAFTYGDRVIELKDGVIISDVCLDTNLKIDDHSILINNLSSLSRNEIDEINKNIHLDKNNKIITPKYFYKDTEQDENSQQENKIEKVKPNFKIKNSLFLSSKFIKNKKINVIISSLVTALLFGVLFCAQSFVTFDQAIAIKDVFKKENLTTFALEKGFFDHNKKHQAEDILQLDDKDFEMIHNDYGKEYSELYNYSLPASLNSWNLQEERRNKIEFNEKNIYIEESFGLLLTCEDYIKQVFDFKKDIPYIALLPEEKRKNEGIYITDYFADSILHYRTKYNSYNDLLGPYSDESKTYAYINGIISTHYKEKYKQLLSQLSFVSLTNSKAMLNRILSSKDFLKACDDIVLKYGICFSMNKDFFNNDINNNARNFITLKNTEIKNAFKFNKEIGVHQSLTSLALNPNELSISLDVFNEKLGTTYTLIEAQNKAKSMSQNDLTIKRFNQSDEQDILVYQKDIKLKVHDTSETKYSIVIGDALFNEAIKHNFISYGVYFENIDKISNVTYKFFNEGFYFSSLYCKSVTDITKASNIFDQFFIFMFLVVMISSLIVLVLLANQLITFNRYNIGVLKTMGYSTKDNFKIFIPYIILLGILTITLFILTSLIFSQIANYLIISAMVQNYNNIAFESITIISMKTFWIPLDISIILFFLIIAIISPLLLLKKIKPIEILHKKERR